MSPAHVALLGALAGLTIFLGLPVALLPHPMPGLRAMLNATAVGILLFLVWDVLSAAWEPIDAALTDKHLGPALGNGLLLTVCLALGLMGLVAFDRIARRRPVRAGATSPAERAPVTVGASTGSGPGAAAMPGPPAPEAAAASKQRIALMIAIGIGLHNLAEGLAIGNSAASGQLALAFALVIGFGLHNATEGFGIVAPLAGERPSWRYLALLGVIGGGPTFLGTLLGQAVVSEPLAVAFLGLAAGSILYVVIELLAVARRFSTREMTGAGILLGLFLGFATDAVLTVAGA